MATKEEIWAAAGALVEAGERPTLSAVRKAVGGGSFTTISEAMTEWRAKQTQPEAPKEPAPDAVLAKAKDLASDIWAQALAMSGERLKAERAALDAARAAMEQELAEAVDLADSLADDLDQARADLKSTAARADSLADEIERQAQEIERLREEVMAAREAAAKARGEVEALERALAKWVSTKEEAEKEQGCSV